MQVRLLTLWMLMLSVTIINLFVIAQQPLPEINELFPKVAVNGATLKVIWQVSKPYDLFQRPNITEPWLPDASIEVEIYPPANGFPKNGAARPKISANAEWLVYHDNEGRVRVWNISGVSPQEVLLIIGWQDTNNDGVREEPQNYDAPLGVFPAVSESGRFIAFLSQRRDLNDPNGDGNGPNTPELNGNWTIYIHDRDADIPQDLNGDGIPDVQGAQGEFDEPIRGATTTRFLPDPNQPDPNDNNSPFRLPNPMRLRHIALEETNSVLRIYVTWVARNGTNWELRLGRWEWDLQNRQWQNVAELLVWVSPVPIQGGFVARGRVAFSVADLIAVHENGNLSLRIQTNGVNGAPVLSPDGTLLAFHSTMTAYRVNGGQWVMLPHKRNAVDDVFVFDLTKLTPIWSTLVFRTTGVLPPYSGCVNPSLTNLNAIAFQQIT
ncbi:MAG: hypothetical protein ACK40X_03595, partial [Armatimonadota bacterium]